MGAYDIPYEKCIDSSISLLSEGYLFIRNRTERYNCDIFRTSLMGRQTVCMTGKQAAELFYDNRLFRRHGAAPKRVQKTLFGKNTVQSMDGKAHIHRKQFFLSVLTPEYRNRLTGLVLRQWQKSAAQWERNKAGRIVLFDEAKKILCRAVCIWAGVPLRQTEIKKRSDDFGAMVDAFGAVGLRYLKGVAARKRTEKWIENAVKDVRSGKLKPGTQSALYRIAVYRNSDGRKMEPHMAAAELINILRPVVALSTYIVFSALALHDNPGYKNKIKSDNSGSFSEMFVQEVRRFYPFTPFVGAIAKKNFIRLNCEFRKGDLVLLDVYGINHDMRIWGDPEEFRPERFSDKNYGPFEFIPQGGGDAATGHRCPGEGIAVDIMKASLGFLVSGIDYDVPHQDLHYSLQRIPTRPKDGFIISNVRRK